MLNNKINKIAFAIVIIVVILFTWFRPHKYESEKKIGTYGTFCDNEYCHINIYSDVPGKGTSICYWIVDKNEISEEDFDEYFYLTDKSKVELEALGYDVSEGSNQELALITFGKYIEGYYYYPEYYVQR